MDRKFKLGSNEVLREHVRTLLTEKGEMRIGSLVGGVMSREGHPMPYEGQPRLLHIIAGMVEKGEIAERYVSSETRGNNGDEFRRRQHLVRLGNTEITAIEPAAETPSSSVGKEKKQEYILRAALAREEMLDPPAGKNRILTEAIRLAGLSITPGGAWYRAFDGLVSAGVFHREADKENADVVRYSLTDAGRIEARRSAPARGIGRGGAESCPPLSLPTTETPSVSPSEVPTSTPRAAPEQAVTYLSRRAEEPVAVSELTALLSRVFVFADHLGSISTALLREHDELRALGAHVREGLSALEEKVSGCVHALERIEKVEEATGRRATDDANALATQLDELRMSFSAARDTHPRDLELARVVREFKEELSRRSEMFANLDAMHARLQAWVLDGDAPHAT
ncbi:MAG: hypothetical protein Q8R39_01645 [bacterium]|nr:hypothetical protein [bacterium]MDZ4285106.1 hypothetical protein [Patescibacteria group bacterium]